MVSKNTLEDLGWEVELSTVRCDGCIFLREGDRNIVINRQSKKIGFGPHDELTGDDYDQLYDLVRVIEDEDMIDRLNSVLEMTGTVIHSLKLKEADGL